MKYFDRFFSFLWRFLHFINIENTGIIYLMLFYQDSYFANTEIDHINYCQFNLEGFSLFGHNIDNANNSYKKNKVLFFFFPNTNIFTST